MKIDQGVNRQEQINLYGEPLGELFSRLGTALGLTQGQLAATIGLSPSMLSQLMSARRIKIGNPAVVQRVHALSVLVDEVRSGAVDPGEIEQRLAEVRSVSGAITRATPAGESTSMARRPAPDDAVQVIRGLLRAVASGRELLEVAETIRADHPEIAEVLELYGVGRVEDAAAHFARHERLM